MTSNLKAIAALLEAAQLVEDALHPLYRASAQLPGQEHATGNTVPVSTTPTLREAVQAEWRNTHALRERIEALAERVLKEGP
jgi:hypothetical protein